MSAILPSDAGVLVAMSMLIVAALLVGFLFGWLSGAGWSQRREGRRQARVAAAIAGNLREVTGPALFARTKGEPFTATLRRHERDARRDWV